MKAVVVFLSLVALSSAAFPAFNIRRVVVTGGQEGQYQPDNSGSYDSNDGRYHPDDSGSYKSDGSGQYSGSFEKYKHQGDQFGGAGAGGGQYTGSFEKYRHQGDQFGAGGSGAGGTGGSGFGARPGAGLGSGNVHGLAASSGFGVPTGLKHGSAAGFYDNRNYAIIRKVEQVEQDGYHYLYETENGITGEEQGKLANKGTDQEAMKASGFFTYTGPDNVVYTVEYTSDENGFIPRAAHIPTPPPIPAAIVRSLEYQKSIGEL